MAQMMVATCAFLLMEAQQVSARLGGPNASEPGAGAVANASSWQPSHLDFIRGGAGRGMAYWSNASLLSSLELVADPHSLPGKMGYEHIATTTRYGDTCCASCGSVSTAKLVEGTGFYAVAAAESMQSHGIGDGHYCTKDGSSSGGTTGMGCLSCAKGRFIAAHPMSYPMWAQPGDAIFQHEINLVVADSCPHAGNEAWCPSRPGGQNNFGARNHFDFAHPPHKFDNYYFAWSKTECPHVIKERYAKLSKC
eukprot:gb/GFBE01078880.1/.p1 GENE.gb/GFBE01078880.1/~~gb/GFBE01078880.1/.p1  ORF type:complete len:251 (+),score=54.53 gb/GFBE01078880.1/:1-753(+)